MTNDELEEVVKILLNRFKIGKIVKNKSVINK